MEAGFTPRNRQDGFRPRDLGGVHSTTGPNCSTEGTTIPVLPALLCRLRHEEGPAPGLGVQRQQLATRAPLNNLGGGEVAGKKAVASSPFSRNCNQARAEQPRAGAARRVAGSKKAAGWTTYGVNWMELGLSWGRIGPESSNPAKRPTRNCGKI